MKLISMTDFVLEQQKNHLSLRDFNIKKYANFLKQPLTLGMFIPCDLADNVLAEPKQDDNRESNFDMINYADAENRVLFNNFKFVESHKEGIDNKLEYFVFPYGENRFGLTKKQEGFRTWFQLFTVEDLVQCDLSLSVSFEAIT